MSASTRIALGLACALQIAAAYAEGTEISIPSDSKARYFILSIGGTTFEPTLLTKRVGPSGVSYTEAVYDCRARTWKYLATGDTMEEMKRSKPDMKMGPLVEGSIAWYKWVYACTS